MEKLGQPSRSVIRHPFPKDQGLPRFSLQIENAKPILAPRANAVVWEIASAAPAVLTVFSTSSLKCNDVRYFPGPLSHLK